MYKTHTLRMLMTLWCCAALCAPASPGETSAAQQWETYISKINTMIQKFSGTAGILIKDLNNGHTYSYNADKKFRSASLIKLPIMAAVFKEFNDGVISFTEKCSLTRGCRVPGSGILKHEANGTEYSIYELVYTMIAKSDNTAARILTERVGYDRMNGIFAFLGLKDTNISSKSFDLTNGEIAGDSYTTPRDITMLLQRIYDRELFKRYLSQQMTEILKLTVDKKRLNKFLPNTFQLAHKTGLLRGACHDAGIVFSPHGDYLVCVLTDANGNYANAKRFIVELGRLTFEQLKKS